MPLMKKITATADGLGTSEAQPDADRTAARGGDRPGRRVKRERAERNCVTRFTGSSRTSTDGSVGHAKRLFLEIACSVKHSPDVLKQAALE
jgi:hypothetical protein